MTRFQHIAPLLFAALLLVAVGSTLAELHTAAKGGPVAALRSTEQAHFGQTGGDDDAPQVDRVCGFAPCGLPILCEAP